MRERKLRPGRGLAQGQQLVEPRAETDTPGVWTPALWTLRRRQRQKQQPLRPAYLLARVLFPDQGPRRSWTKDGSTSWRERRSEPRGLSTPALCRSPAKRMLGMSSPTHTHTHLPPSPPPQAMGHPHRLWVIPPRRSQTSLDAQLWPSFRPPPPAVPPT